MIYIATRLAIHKPLLKNNIRTDVQEARLNGIVIHQKKMKKVLDQFDGVPTNWK